MEITTTEIDIQTLITKTFGGGGGSAFNPRGIKTLAIRSGNEVDAIIINNEHFGGTGGTLSKTITLAPDEVIIRMDIRSGSRIDKLSIFTSEGQKIEGGGNGGRPSTIIGKIIMFGGRSAASLDQLQVLGDFDR